MTEQPDPTAVADAAVRRIQNEAETAGMFLPISVDGPLAGEELIPGLMYRYQETTADQSRLVTLTIYLGVGKLGAALWNQELATLERLSGTGHAALPELLDGATLPADGSGPGVSYIRTRTHEILDEDAAEIAQMMNRNREHALRHLWILADALSVIHDSRVVHRNLWSGSLDFSTAAYPDEEIEESAALRALRLRLARFEMSGMFSNLIRGWRRDRSGADDVRQHYLRQPLRSRVFAPPERLRFLFGDGDGDTDPFAGDVFGLGMVAVEWLLGPDALGEDSDYTSLQSLLSLQERIRRDLRTSTLPPALSTLIGDMIGANPPRPRALQVVDGLSRAYNEAQLSFSSGEPQRPLLVAYMGGANYADKTLLRWGHLGVSSTTDEGRTELAELVRSDMRGARLYWSSAGAAPYLWETTNGDSLKASQTVIVGEKFVWFASQMRKGKLLRSVPYPAIQIVRFVLERHRIPATLESFLRSQPFRVLPGVEPIDFDLVPAVLAEKSQGREEEWEQMLDGLKVTAPEAPASAKLRRSMDWYLTYQKNQLRTREYAYRVIGRPDVDTVRITADLDAESTRIRRTQDALLNKMLSDASRPPLEQFVTAAAYQGDAVLRIQLAATNAELYNGVTATFRSAEGSTALVLDVPRGVPDHGWLRLADDGPTDRQLDAQTKATVALTERRALLAQLTRPRSSPRNQERWSGAAGELHGEGAEAVVDMLAHESLFVMQGPPGTGKTTVTSHAVAAYLTKEPGARILISAQSNDALDNLAERILARLAWLEGGKSARFSALRIASRMREETASDAMKPHLEAAAVTEMRRTIERETRKWLRTRGPERPKAVAVLQSWLEMNSRLELDLRFRLRRGANLVFATTGASTTARLVDRGTTEPFDWVIVEEAARAWPTELIMPLVHGTRWTMIGDQAQIGAYGRNQIVGMLEELGSDPDPELVALWASRYELAAGFDLFASLFPADGEDPATWQRVLHEQYRMDDRIAQLSSRAFYDATLKSPKGWRSHRMQHPQWIMDRAIVWVDTSERGARAVEFWSNDAEAREVASIVRSFAPELKHQEMDLAVLTPYREQAKRLSGRLGEFANRIFTIDSFQGREADVVVASLVRDRVMPDRDGLGNIGHLFDPGRANVLLSRARSLFVVVGNLEVYRNHAGPDWAGIVDTVEREGVVVTLAEAGLA